ncbi:ORC-CDC6 family AAA ATPase [Zhongshania marina]|uniref:Uncharacterized protein n=1 Tax=Zhongshania marina TaxID=2304603 RepID=A0ABX9W1U2_9GAMM|nr:hypothetical protein D0911_11425 [Zhongshania marina]
MKDYDGPLDKASTLIQLFGENRAEWPPESFKDLFVPPTYIDKLELMRPSILVGGRGTGKTTSLQSLRFSETLERLKLEGLSFSDQNYLGILIRINKNRVHAFQGALTESEWKRAFAHYFNLLVCSELCKLGSWLEELVEIKVNEDDLTRISIDLGLGGVVSFDNLFKQVNLLISKLQLYVNNPHSDHGVVFSMPESPLRVFAEVLEDTGLLNGKVIFCCIDEYENLLDYQQGVINTYIKHASPPLSYKVGVRKFGIRNWSTTDNQDLLSNPDDFELIEIVDEGFEYFATAVANKRLAFASEKGIAVSGTIDQLLLNMSMEEEALKLGADKVSDEVKNELRNSGLNKPAFDFFENKKGSEVYFLKYWQEKTGDNICDIAKDWYENESSWETRLGNHGYASLFWLSKGKKGLRIKKYYSGSKTMLALAGGNIRYFLQLLKTSIEYEIGDKKSEFPEPLILTPESQTLALRDVGKRRLEQIEGLAEQGVKLKRLILGIGKVFFELARSPANRSPEVVSFVVTGSNEEIEKISALLQDGVGHLAFEVFTRTKNTSKLEVKDEEFRLHRIFSGFFEISHRKKRRATFKAKDLLAVVEGKPTAAISALLSDQDATSQEELPEQLAFFSAFYNDNENGE